MTNITYAQLRNIKKHLRSSYRDQAWWDFHNTAEVSAVEIAIGCALPDSSEKDIYESANKILDSIQNKE
jgi:endonuclease III-like uncharacterized protein